jgi:hypothetical protein
MTMRYGMRRVSRRHPRLPSGRSRGQPAGFAASGRRPRERRPDAGIGDELPDGRCSATVETAELVLALGVPMLGVVDRLMEAGRAEQYFEVAAVHGRSRVVAVATAAGFEPIDLVLDRGAGHSLRISLRSAPRIRDLPQGFVVVTPNPRITHSRNHPVSTDDVEADPRDAERARNRGGQPCR